MSYKIGAYKQESVTHSSMTQGKLPLIFRCILREIKKRLRCKNCTRKFNFFGKGSYNQIHISPKNIYKWPMGI